MGIITKTFTLKIFEERKRLPFAKSSFKKYVINIDLTKLNQAEIDDGNITSEKNAYCIRT